FVFSSRRRHTSFSRDWSSDVCSSDLGGQFDDVRLEFLPASLRGPRPARLTAGGVAEECWLAVHAVLPSMTARRSAIKRLVLRIRSEERRVGDEAGARGAGDGLKEMLR